MKEEGVEFAACKNVFYNPEMKFCRSISSLAVGAIERKLVLCDAFAATGIRGIRYAVENRNVSNLILVDMDRRATACAKKNARKNKLKSKILHGNISRLVFGIVADFVEVDPFGSPSPYLYDVMRAFNPLKEGYLSVTATDTAVLCGGKVKAAMKNYHSRPLNNEFTHEIGLRIMIKKITEVAAEFNFGIEPLFSLSDRHYLKAVIKLTRSADAADESLKQLGYIEFCQHCGFRRTAKFPGEKCANCGHRIEYAGPLWLGELHNEKFLDKMAKLDKKRNYSQKEELKSMIGLLKGEIGMPPYYYNLHEMSRRYSKGSIPRMAEIIDKIKSKGHKAARTHFSNISIKTTMPYRELISFLGKSKK